MAELVELRAPLENREGTRAIVSRWLKTAGDKVAKDEPIVELTTDKVSLELASPCDGILKSVALADNTEVEPGALLAIIDSTAGAVTVPKSGSPQSHSNFDPVSDLSPAVKKLLSENNLTASILQQAGVKGGGKGGRLRQEDVESYLKIRQQSGNVHSREGAGKIASHFVPHSAARLQISAHLQESVKTAPHVTALFEANLSAVKAHRASLKEKGHEAPTFSAYFIWAVIQALKVVPECNARYHHDGLEIYDQMNLGLAMAVSEQFGGLVVPVIENAGNLSLEKIAQLVTLLTEKARSGKLQAKDIANGTFTISNHGVSGSLLAMPIIIHQPQVAILGVGKIEDRVKVTSAGVFEAIPMVYVTLTIDHRALDGFHCNKFLTAWVSAIESIAREDIL